jgi:hypothetical protein
MQSEIAPPVEPEDRPDPIEQTLDRLNGALAACLDEIESLQDRVARLEAERARAG